MGALAEIMEHLCATYQLVLILHMLLWLGFVLNTLTILLIDLGPAGRTVTMLNYAGLIVMLSGSGFVLYWCNRSSE